MAELGIGKLDDNNDSIKLNGGVPSDTNLESGGSGAAAGDLCSASRKHNNVDKLVQRESNNATNALANGHLSKSDDQGTPERGGDDGSATTETTTNACLDDPMSCDESDPNTTNGEESFIRTSSSTRNDRTTVSSSCSNNSNNSSELPRTTDSGLSITIVSSTSKSADEQNSSSRWNDETTTAKTDDSENGNTNDDDEMDDDTISINNTPDKHKKNGNNNNSGSKKSPASLNVTPRRSSRNINKQKTNDTDGEERIEEFAGVQLLKKLTGVAHTITTTTTTNSSNDDDDIEEVTPVDPLADDSKSRLQLPPQQQQRNKTIVVSDTKGLVEYATNARVSSKCNKKEPTLVIIDTKSILSGRGPVPVSHSSGGTSALLHTAGGSAPIPVSLPISASALANTSRAMSTSAAFSVIPIGLSGQGLYPQYKNPPPQMKPIVVGPASTTVTPISLHTALAHQQQQQTPPSVQSSMAATVSVTPPATKQQPPIVLPSLTDDMFVVEAPSFIVPYVYEKPPMKALKEHLEKIETEIKEAEAKEKEEEAAREAEKRLEEEKKIEEEREAQKKDDEEKDDEGKEKTEDEKMEEDESGEATKESVPTAAAEDEKEKIENDGKSDEKKELGDDEQTSAEKTQGAEPAIETSAEDTDKTKSADDGKTLDLTATTLDKKEDTAVEKKDEQQQTPSATKDDKKSAVDDSKKPLSFFDNPLGKFFIQIGLNLVQEHVQTDLLRSQRRKRDKEGENCSPEVLATISELTRTLESSKENNDPFKLDMKKCELCSFRTESLLAMAHHLETPHMKNYTYRCNFCPLEVRSPHDILFHMEAEHNVRGRLERAPAFHQCPNCPFEDNQKGKLTRHMVSCSKKYRPEKNQEPPLDWEPPAKIPRVTRNRPPSMSPGNAVYQAAMSGLKQVPQNTLLPKLMPNATNLKQQQQQHNLMNANKRPNTVNATNFVGRFPNASSQSNFQPRSISIQTANQGLLYRTPLTNSQTQVLLPQNYQLPVSNASLYQSSNVKQQPQQGLAAAKLLNQPSISITPLPRQTTISQQGSSSNNTVINSTGLSKAGKQPPASVAAAAGAANSKNSFVVCEICDGYIKDLEQLRNHMQWIHKVKIHPKMIYNRPPLNCQKCQYRFFTDQGLERHLLGSHGLVTSSMQEAANKGKDGGRCPVCGRVYQWKLLNHVARDHQMALKPAHLSYKCTVCTATFGMYKQFESHVYSAHSMVAKRAMDPKKPPLASSSASSQSDALLKPLKINDEITIIPQPVRTTKPMNKITSSASNVVNSRSKDDCDRKYCGRMCVLRDFPSVEEFQSHLLTKHAKPFRIKILRCDDQEWQRAQSVDEGEGSSPQPLPPAPPPPPPPPPLPSTLDLDSSLRIKYGCKPFDIRADNLHFLRDDYVYVIERKDDDNDDMAFAYPQIGILEGLQTIYFDDAAPLPAPAPAPAPTPTPTRTRRPLSSRAATNNVVPTSAPVAPPLDCEADTNLDTFFGGHFMTPRYPSTSSSGASKARGLYSAAAVANANQKMLSLAYDIAGGRCAVPTPTSTPSSRPTRGWRQITPTRFAVNVVRGSPIPRGGFSNTIAANKPQYRFQFSRGRPPTASVRGPSMSVTNRASLPRLSSTPAQRRGGRGGRSRGVSSTARLPTSNSRFVVRTSQQRSVVPSSSTGGFVPTSRSKSPQRNDVIDLLSDSGDDDEVQEVVVQSPHSTVRTIETPSGVVEVHEEEYILPF